MDQSVAIEGLSLLISGATATIWLNRPAARNAMLLSSWKRLAELVQEADASPHVAVIVLRGTGGHFGAGNDIAEFGQMAGNRMAASDYAVAMATAMRAVETASKPVIAAIEGSCFGASVALVLAADIRFASSTAKLAITPAKLGAVYLMSDHHRLVATVGPGQARRMIFTAQALDAEQALAIGLVDDVASADEFDPRLTAMTEAIAAGSPYTLRHSKRMMRAAGYGPTPEENEETINWFANALMAPDFAEGVTAFLEKRPARFDER